MKRREFIAATAALLVSLRRSRAQGRPRRIGFLGAWADEPARDPVRAAWLRALHELGWIEGKNLLAEYRYAPDRLPALAAELVALTPELIMAPGPQSALALIGYRNHSDCIRGCGRSLGALPRAKPIAPKRQHNGPCDHGA